MNYPLYQLAKSFKIDKILKSNVYVYHFIRTILARLDIFLPLEPDFQAFKILPIKDGIFLDIGANDGISARSFRKFNKATPILSIEPNKLHVDVLDRLKSRLDGFDFIIVGANDREDILTLHTPKFKRIYLTAYASVDKKSALQRIENNTPSIVNKVSFHTSEVKVIPLDALKLRPGYIKIDVEGHELAVLNGLIETITYYKPIMMIEYDPLQFQNILDYLLNFDYRPFIFNSKKSMFEEFNSHKIDNVFFIHSTEPLIKDEIKVIV